MSRHSADHTPHRVPRWLTFQWLTVTHLKIATGVLAVIFLVLAGLIGTLALTGTTEQSSTPAAAAPPARLPTDYSSGGLATVEMPPPARTPEPPVVVEPQMAPAPGPVPYVEPPWVVLVPVPAPQTPATEYRDVPVPVETRDESEPQRREREHGRDKPDDTPTGKPDPDEGEGHDGRDVCVGPVCFDDQRDHDDADRTGDHGRTDGKPGDRGEKS